MIPVGVLQLDNGIYLRLTAELAGKYALIVIFVCMSVGMWSVLEGVYILGVEVWVFRLGLAFLRSCFVLCIVLCYFFLFGVCLFAFFLDVFKSTIGQIFSPRFIRMTII